VLETAFLCAICAIYGVNEALAKTRKKCLICLILVFLKIGICWHFRPLCGRVRILLGESLKYPYTVSSYFVRDAAGHMLVRPIGRAEKQYLDGKRKTV
jgi:hypothetical protein